MRCPKGCLFPLEEEKITEFKDGKFYFNLPILVCCECGYEWVPKKTGEIQEASL